MNLTNKKIPFFSIIIPAYNIDKYIEECITSVVLQKFYDYELIVINDGSTDNTLEILNGLRVKHNIKVISKQNSGLSDTRNLGISESTGKYLIFLDGDDFILEDSLSNLFNDIKDSLPDICITKMIEMSNDILYYKDRNLSVQGRNEFNKKYIIRKIFRKSQNTWPSVRYIVKSDFIKSNNLHFLRNYLHEDVLWTTNLFIKAEKIQFTNNHWYVHRVDRVDSITNKVSINRVYNIIDIVKISTNNVDKSIIINSTSKKIIKSRLSLSLYNIFKYTPFFTKAETKQLSTIIKDNMFLFKNTKKIKHRLFLFAYNRIGLIKLKRFLKWKYKID